MEYAELLKYVKNLITHLEAGGKWLITPSDGVRGNHYKEITVFVRGNSLHGLEITIEVATLVTDGHHINVTFFPISTDYMEKLLILLSTFNPNK